MTRTILCAEETKPTDSRETPAPPSITQPTDDQRARDDAQDLERLGYAQEFFRGFGGFSNFAISFSIISILTGAVTLFDYGLTMGGPLEMTLGWPIVTAGTLLVALSMAELCSALPTSGGMYHWSAELGGPMWAWFTAWLNIVGLVACIAGIDYGCALFLVPLLGLESSGSTLLIVYGLLLLSQAVINHYSTRLIAWLNDLSVTVHILGVAVIIGALWIFAPKQPATFLLKAVSSSHIHGSYLWLFLLGLLQAQWTFTGFDASAHVAEETVDPRRRAPWGMVLSVIVSGFFGYLLILSLTWAIPDIHRVLGATDSGGHPIPAVLAIVEMTLGSRAGVIVLGLTVLAMWFCGLAACTSVSRTFYAFARDNGMPLSRLWSRIDPRHKTPVLAIWLSAVLAFGAMVYSGAYSVVTSISVVGLYLSYIIPVYLGWRKKRLWISKRGPWNLGKSSNAINALAVIWTVGICAIMVMPPNTRAGLGIAAVMGVLLLLHLAVGKHKVETSVWNLEGKSVKRVASDE
ncbi:MAG: amino acid permease [Acidobacteriota bacterium]|nr:amino acid permease [Acidobacteriota bacterium]